MLAIEGLGKRYGRLQVIDDFPLALGEREVVGIIGPNGAGKSTAFNLLTGFDTPDSGTVEFEGEILTGLKPHKVTRLGVARTFQNTQLFNEMTVLDNVLVGTHPRTKTGFLAAALRLPGVGAEERLARENAMHLLRLVSLDHAVDVIAADLPHGQRRLLEIARALATGPRLLLLDEPAAGLNSAETEQLGEMLYRIRDMGVTIVIVEHDMALVMDVSDQVIVLNEGVKIAEGPPRLIQKDPVVIEFLGLPESPRLVETDLEQKLIDNLQTFLLELGKGFAFVARQQRLTLEGDHFYIDLVFYHTILKCYVLIDLNTGKLTHEDLGQLQLYVNYYDRERRTEGDQPTLGLILCTDKNDTVVKYTLGPDQQNKIFASRYKLHLPTEKELEDEIRREVRFLTADEPKHSRRKAKR